MYRDNQVTLPLTFLDRPSSHRLDLGLRIIKGKSLVFRFVYKGYWGLRVRDHVEIIEEKGFPAMQIRNIN